MDLAKLKSAITKIRMASVSEEEIDYTLITEKIDAIKKAFQDFWQSEHLPLANKLISVFEVVSPHLF